MDLDHLKELYTQEEISETPEISLEKQKEIHLPLEKIRANMRLEFWSSVVVFIAIFAAVIFLSGEFKLRFYVGALVGSMVIVTAFFYYKFFQLYKEIGDPSLQTKETLKDLLNQFELNKQYYISYYLSFVPFFICEMIIINEFNSHMEFHGNVVFAVSFVFVVVFTLVLLFLIGKYWFQEFYGKYIDQIKKLLVDLTEE